LGSQEQVKPGALVELVDELDVVKDGVTGEDVSVEEDVEVLVVAVDDVADAVVEVGADEVDMVSDEVVEVVSDEVAEPVSDETVVVEVVAGKVLDVIAVVDTAG